MGTFPQGSYFFRLGLASLPHDFVRGRQELESAYQEDLTLETSDDAAPRAYNQSAYVALTILERIDDSEIVNQVDKQRFIDRFFQSFDAAIFGVAVLSDKVEIALKRISPPDGLMSCLAAYRELREVRKKRLSFAIVSLTGTVLEALLLAELYHRRKLTILSDGRDILKVQLGALMEEGIKLSVFPADSIRVAFQLVHFFRNRLHPGNEMCQKYKLQPQVAWTISVSFELAAIEWSSAFPELP